MRAKITNGEVHFSLQEMVDDLSKEDRTKVARMVMADEDVFAAVLDCVVDGMFFPDEPEGAWWFDSQKVLELRTKLLPLMDTVAQEAVRRALTDKKASEAEARRYRDWAFALYHAWPDSHWRSRPAGPPDFKPTMPVSDEEVKGHMEKSSG